ncbi:hypothetical protein AAK943_02540 [Emergencia timonensis]|uniref:hypothetical protein n=1 Tax=Emergencia timonensis TaxID=1776384 RepID=UPI0008297A41|nr:hypothetical protein [Emergencia timonensis]WNX90535.1 hypothetical protein RVY71_09795 [Emergencia timonensis]
MRIFTLELNNDIKGIAQRKIYIEDLIAKLDRPDFVVLPELAVCSYMASQKIWQYTDDYGKDTSSWATALAGKVGLSYSGVRYAMRQSQDEGVLKRSGSTRMVSGSFKKFE